MLYLSNFTSIFQDFCQFSIRKEVILVEIVPMFNLQNLHKKKKIIIIIINELKNQENFHLTVKKIHDF